MPSSPATLSASPHSHGTSASPFSENAVNSAGLDQLVASSSSTGTFTSNIESDTAVVGGIVPPYDENSWDAAATKLSEEWLVNTQNSTPSKLFHKPAQPCPGHGRSQSADSNSLYANGAPANTTPPLGGGCLSPLSYARQCGLLENTSPTSSTEGRDDDNNINNAGTNRRAARRYSDTAPSSLSRMAENGIQNPFDVGHSNRDLLVDTGDDSTFLLGHSTAVSDIGDQEFMAVTGIAHHNKASNYRPILTQKETGPGEPVVVETVTSDQSDNDSPSQTKSLERKTLMERVAAAMGRVPESELDHVESLHCAETIKTTNTAGDGGVIMFNPFQGIQVEQLQREIEEEIANLEQQHMHKGPKDTEGQTEEKPGESMVSKFPSPLQQNRVKLADQNQQARDELRRGPEQKEEKNVKKEDPNLEVMASRFHQNLSIACGDTIVPRPPSVVSSSDGSAPESAFLGDIDEEEMTPRGRYLLAIQRGARAFMARARANSPMKKSQQKRGGWWRLDETTLDPSSTDRTPVPSPGEGGSLETTSTNLLNHHHNDDQKIFVPQDSDVVFVASDNQPEAETKRGWLKTKIRWVSAEYEQSARSLSPSSRGKKIARLGVLEVAAPPNSSSEGKVTQRFHVACEDSCVLSPDRHQNVPNTPTKRVRFVDENEIDNECGAPMESTSSAFHRFHCGSTLHPEAVDSEHLDSARSLENDVELGYDGLSHEECQAAYLAAASRSGVQESNGQDIDNCIDGKVSSMKQHFEMEDNSNRDENTSPMDSLRTTLLAMWSNSKPKETGLLQPRAIERVGQASSDSNFDKETVNGITAEESSEPPIVVSTMGSLRSSLMAIWNSKPRPNLTPGKRFGEQSKGDVEVVKSISPPSPRKDEALSASCRSPPRNSSPSKSSRSRHSTSLPMGNQYFDDDHRDGPSDSYLSNMLDSHCRDSLPPRAAGSYDSLEEYEEMNRSAKKSQHTDDDVNLKRSLYVKRNGADDSYISENIDAYDPDGVKDEAKFLYEVSPRKKDWHPPEGKQTDPRVQAILDNPDLVDKQEPPQRQLRPCNWAKALKIALMAFGIIAFLAIVSSCLYCGVTGSCLTRFNATDPGDELPPLAIDLPDFTTIKLRSVNSAQAKAYVWLENDPGHMWYNQTRKLQRFALATLYFATTVGQNWTDSSGWLSYETHECYWFSTYDEFAICEDDAYNRLMLANNNMRGTIPPEISFLTSLESIDLSRNTLYGSIPEEIGTLTGLETLWLDRNELKGNIPESLGSLTNLKNLSLATNDFQGTVPEALGSCTNLTSLRLFYNYLTGEIPASFGDLSNLKTLDVDVNEFSGTIPTSLGRLTGLEVLWLDWNSFVGPIITELGLLTNLSYLYLGRAFIPDYMRHDDWRGSGIYTIPTQLGQLTKLQELYMDHNFLTGTIPSEFSNFSLLKRVALDNNHIIDTISPEMCLLFNGALQELSVDCDEVLCTCGCTCAVESDEGSG